MAIFSLKLKERRQREAEKAAAIAVEHAKVAQNITIIYIRSAFAVDFICWCLQALAKLQAPVQAPGGELSLIPIEQLIKIEDITTPIKPPVCSTAAGPGNVAGSSTSSALQSMINSKAVTTSFKSIPARSDQVVATNKDT